MIRMCTCDICAKKSSEAKACAKEIIEMMNDEKYASMNEEERLTRALLNLEAGGALDFDCSLDKEMLQMENAQLREQVHTIGDHGLDSLSHLISFFPPINTNRFWELSFKAPLIVEPDKRVSFQPTQLVGDGFNPKDCTVFYCAVALGKESAPFAYSFNLLFGNLQRKTAISKYDVDLIGLLQSMSRYEAEMHNFALFIKVLCLILRRSSLVDLALSLEAAWIINS